MRRDSLERNEGMYVNMGDHAIKSFSSNTSLLPAVRDGKIVFPVCIQMFISAQ